MDLDALPAYLAALRDAAGEAAIPAANAMGTEVKRQVTAQLKLVAHAPGIFWKAAPSRPPAYASGHLAGSMMMVPASTAVVATALVGNTAIYAAIQEFGGPTWPNRSAYMHWVNTGGSWYKKRITIPQHPYFRPTVERLIANGGLTREAMSAFWVRILPFFSG